MAVTIKQLAQYCGLSVSAVSKALNGYSDVSDATRQAVMKAAQELDYRPNAHARALKSRRSYNLGVLFRDDNLSGLTHPFFSVVLEYFKQEAEQEGYDITFIGHHMGSGRVTYLDHCRYREVDGVCVACTDFYDPEIRQLVHSDYPVVTIDHRFEGVPCVFSDNTGGIRQLVEYIYSLGHRRIAYIHGHVSAVTDVRLETFLKTAEALGLTLPTEYIQACSYNDSEDARHSVRALMELKDRPTCIMICDDYAALGAFNAASERGLHIPEDLSISGFDGIAQMQAFRPRLTTVYQDAPQMGREAARLLISRIEGKDVPETLVIPTRLIPGETVAKPAAR